MKCTSKRRTCFQRGVALLCAASLLFLLSGCGGKEIPLAYDPASEVSGFRIADDTAGTVAASFAQDLCVATGDVATDTASVDTEALTAAGLFDLNRHEVLYARNIHERLNPASLTKIMTAVVALKYGNTEDTITVTDEARITESGATLCGLETGDQLTLNQALHALLIASANDAAAAIAVHIGGSIEGFAELMNEEAVAIGATNSHFVNPHGLTADDHYVTAYDMYLIFNEALKYDLISEIIHMTSYETVYMDSAGNSKSLSFHTTNQYLNGTYKAPGQVTVIGGKTGTTSAAGSCLVLLARDTAGNPYISVILKATARDILYEQMTRLLNVIA
ncbi:MAG TPA: D-alanyl-D-alanine carboxypeptidase [Candidatus Eisenbergiella pullistercoris]|uniref:D-alanyl-D-alanine carboxypeptidase n=1 Tax=Candidatus Eisenbergiella pullistercoris TaxID=2838555 RepID=A0A9D1YMG6_9FIRM|nr:D-alanyl-D-alanine carboxypeptidase [Candidatus Eisenbergiella pullistercoris]